MAQTAGWLVPMDQLSPNVLHLGPKRDPMNLLPMGAGAWMASLAREFVREVVQPSEGKTEVAIEP